MRLPIASFQSRPKAPPTAASPYPAAVTAASLARHKGHARPVLSGDPTGRSFERPDWRGGEYLLFAPVVPRLLEAESDVEDGACGRAVRGPAVGFRMRRSPTPPS